MLRKSLLFTLLLPSASWAVCPGDIAYDASGAGSAVVVFNDSQGTAVAGVGASRPEVGDYVQHVGSGGGGSVSDYEWRRIGAVDGVPLVEMVPLKVGPKLQNPGPPNFNCDATDSRGQQPKPIDTKPLPLADYTDTPNSRTIVERVGGQGLSGMYEGTSLDFIEYLVKYAPSWTPEGGGSERKNSCSAPGFQDPILDGGGAFVWHGCVNVTTVATPGNYGIYSRKIPKDCQDMPGYERSAGECRLFAEAMVQKPADTVPCEGTYQNGVWQVDPQNPTCRDRATIRTIQEGVEFTDDDGRKIRVQNGSNGGMKYEVEEPSGDSWSRWELGPWDSNRGGRPVTGTEHGTGGLPPVGGGGSSGGDGSGNGGSSGGEGENGGSGTGGECGIPGKPACAVSVDDSAFGDPQGKFGAGLDELASKTDLDRERVLGDLGSFNFLGLDGGLQHLKPEFTGFFASIVPPSNCQPLPFGIGQYSTEIDLCGQLEQARVVLAWFLWVVCMSFLLSTFRRATTMQPEA